MAGGQSTAALREGVVHQVDYRVRPRCVGAAIKLDGYVGRLWGKTTEGVEMVSIAVAYYAIE